MGGVRVTPRPEQPGRVHQRDGRHQDRRPARGPGGGCDPHRLVERAGQCGHPEPLEDRHLHGVHQVRQPPDHSLRLARRAAGVHEELIGPRPRPGRARRVRGEQLSELNGIRHSDIRHSGTRARPDEQAQRREPGRDVRDVPGQLGAEHHGRGVGVGQQREQLLAGVPVVDVDWHRAELEGGEHRLQVGGPVVQVARDLVPGTDAGVRQRGGQPRGPLLEFRVAVVPARV